MTPPPVAVTVTVELPAGVAEPAVTVIVDDPDPGAPIEAGLKLAVAPEGSPDADNEIAELNPPDIVVDIVEAAEPPCTTDSAAGESVTEKSLTLDGLNFMSRSGCSSIPFGATPVWPWRKSNIATPVTWTGMFAVWKLPFAVNFASNSDLALLMPARSGLLLPTQCVAGISHIIVRPPLSCMTRW
ncbi:MAG TPA: hypothetical protein VJX67_04630 [Blastocatellia bacterium]|nr:hypothetical protein [Blastocatellia bacterium]